MKNWIFCFLAFNSLGQFCGPATNKGVLIPTNSVQVNPATGNGQRPYWSFTAISGCTYTFETCGLTFMDTELEILRASDLLPIVYNDDACSFQSRIVFTAPSSGTYIIFLTRFGLFGSCYALNNNVSLRYFTNCSPSSLALSIIDLKYSVGNNISFKTGVEQGVYKITLKRGGVVIKEFTPQGSGHSYYHLDEDFESGDYNYYSISEINFEGEERVIELFVIDNSEVPSEIEVIGVYNVLGQKVNEESYQGLKVIYYSDGSTRKVVSE